MPTTVFYSGTDWEQSSGPFCNRYFEEADLWPEGAGSEIDNGDKDELAPPSTTQAQQHPVLAIGAKANRPRNLTGVVVVTEDANKVLVNIAHCMVVRQYVANITAYSGGAASAWDASLEAGDPVYVDDSGPLAAGVTLSRAQTNESTQANPLAGYIFYCQDDYLDTGFGGLHTTAGLPHTASSTQTEYVLTCVLLTPDFA
jgi:hypothetical protein